MMSFSRRLLRSRWGWGLTAIIAAGYALLSMSASGMVEWGAGGAWSAQWSPAGVALILRGYGFSATLPIGPTLITAVVSAGVGFGLAVGLSIPLRSRRVHAQSGGNSAAFLASLTPSMMALATLGACCSTITSSAAGMIPSWGGHGPATGGPAWMAPELLGLVQAILLGAALLAQERLLRVFALPLGLADPIVPKAVGREASWRRRLLGGLPFAAFSLGLVVAGAIVAAGALLSPVVTGLPGPILLEASVGGGAPAALALLFVLGPALLAGYGSNRTLGWIRPSLRGSLAGLGRAYCLGESISDAGGSLIPGAGGRYGDGVPTGHVGESHTAWPWRYRRWQGTIRAPFRSSPGRPHFMSTRPFSPDRPASSLSPFRTRDPGSSMVRSMLGARSIGRPGLEPFLARGVA